MLSIIRCIYFPLVLVSVCIGETVFRVNNLTDSVSEYFSLHGLHSNPIDKECLNIIDENRFRILNGNELFYGNEKIGSADTILFQKSIDNMNYCIVKKWYNKTNSLLGILRFLISHPIQVEDIILVRISPTNAQKTFKLKEVKQGIEWNVQYCIY